MDFHEVAEIFPMMSQEALSELTADIRVHGLISPLVVYEEKILDGRNRYLACQQIGVEPCCEMFQGDDPLGFVVSMNLKRRHLTREQRNEVIRNLRIQGMTLQKIAEVVGVNIATAQRATVHDPTFAFAKVPSVMGVDGKVRPTHYTSRRPVLGEGDEDTHEMAEGMKEDIDGTERSPVPPHVMYNAGDNEWYTPQDYIERVVAVMGAIDLDPASTAIANVVVGATCFYTSEEDGLQQEWRGRVFLNPPYSTELIRKFIEKLLTSSGVTEAIVLVNNATETGWFQVLADRASAICFPKGRIKFWHPRKESVPLQGQALVYLGVYPERFIQCFSDQGTTWCKADLTH
jgi:ParB family chromosome partitioning protein